MKKDMVTRTLVSTAVTVLGVNGVSAETSNETMVFPGVIKDNEKALAMFKKAAKKKRCASGFSPGRCRIYGKARTAVRNHG